MKSKDNNWVPIQSLALILFCLFSKKKNFLYPFIWCEFIIKIWDEKEIIITKHNFSNYFLSLKTSHFNLFLLHCRPNKISSKSFSYKLLHFLTLNFFQCYFFAFSCFICSWHQNIFALFLTFYFTMIIFFIIKTSFLQHFFIFTISFLILIGNLS